MNYINKLGLILFVIFIFSCSKNYDGVSEKFIQTNNPELVNKRIDFVEKDYFKVNDFTNNNNNKNIKILKLINTSCTSCFLEMEKWKKHIKEKNILENLSVRFLAIGDYNSYFRSVVKDYNYPFEIYLDSIDTFLSKNNFIYNPLETFWLGDNDTIVMIKSPLENKLMLELLKSKMK
ncbi:hypothetical protein [Polaribacter cellanae]|uniref:Uncharacterized protein n=1 Tax=Polaribacter cellanae TaxID=2818493 RepID=A0A975CQB1_9FLAO|nr:hypothetical protein [Polaribacter cellanae]QTE23539.1 hypothetical protein J3359_04450 [Polaribacter cellanae]